jgi:putative transposase
LNILTELKNRGVNDILIVCVDGLKGFPDAINAVFPETDIQFYIVHMVRNSMKYVPYNDYKKVAADLKSIYKSATEDEALWELDVFAETWDSKYPQISRSWRKHWENLNTLFKYPDDIRKAIYTTNAIESLSSVIRKATNKRKVFPTDESAMKVVYLAVIQASEKWTMLIRNGKPALNRFTIEFEDRLRDFI